MGLENFFRADGGKRHPDQVFILAKDKMGLARPIASVAGEALRRRIFTLPKNGIPWRYFSGHFPVIGLGGIGVVVKGDINGKAAALSLIKPAAVLQIGYLLLFLRMQ